MLRLPGWATTTRGRRSLAAAGAAAAIVAGFLTSPVGTARADTLPIPPNHGKTWEGAIYQIYPIPYVQVFDVKDYGKGVNFRDRDLEFYNVLAPANWVIDCKYYDKDLGWMVRGWGIDGIEEAEGTNYTRGRRDAYYETGFLASTYLGGLGSIVDITDICFPGGGDGPNP